ncbi:YebB family permuted papain-like enzyme [Pseudocitrobacter cyperus]|uniref:YebB family permuted papain-like enzyme n=1 Tax=Pseudocitrobacter cyperus TaxID=3112843 RepID=A0ABV0HCP6_9ENTR
MDINYPVKYETGDIVFTAIGARLFGQISTASRCWSNHVGIIIGHNSEDYLVAESRVPLSTITTLSRFIQRSTGQRYAVRRLAGGLTAEQKLALVERVPGRLHKLYHTGFKYDSARQFCSKFVFDIYKEALCIPVGEIETFGNLLHSNPGAKLTFWKFWFLGSIPWERKTVTPASLWHHPNLVLIDAKGIETPQPEMAEAI